MGVCKARLMRTSGERTRAIAYQSSFLFAYSLCSPVRRSIMYHIMHPDGEPLLDEIKRSIKPGLVCDGGEHKSMRQFCAKLSAFPGCCDFVVRLLGR
jgi:hypothetical protein